jgi:malonyl-CoA reductase/3-hydroxypropionate dehydrogenase (NADP+)
VHQCQVGQVVLVTATVASGVALKRALRDLRGDVLQLLSVEEMGGKIETALDDALLRFGHPTTVVSTLFAPLPDALFDRPAHGGAEAMLPPEGFRALVEVNLTHHFRVARKASLIDGAQLVLVTPDVELGRDRDGAGFALANFIKTTLHAFTVTLAVENERLPHVVPVSRPGTTNCARRSNRSRPRRPTCR